MAREYALHDFKSFKFTETFYGLIWSLLENVPFALENNMYSALVGWNVL